MKMKTIMLTIITMMVLLAFCICADDTNAETGETKTHILTPESEGSDKYIGFTLEEGAYRIEIVQQGTFWTSERGYTTDNGVAYVIANSNSECYFSSSEGYNSITCTVTPVDKIQIKVSNSDEKGYGYTKFPVKAGKLTIKTNNFWGYLCLGDEHIQFQDGEVYVPFDYDDAYLYLSNTYSEENSTYIACEIIKAEESYNHKNKLFGDNRNTDFDSPSYIYLPAGTYDITFSRTGYVTPSTSYSSTYFTAGTSGKLEVKNGDAYFFYFNQHSSTGTYAEKYPVNYNISPEVHIEKVTEDIGAKTILSSTSYSWYKGEFNLSKGTHKVAVYANGADSQYATFIKGSDDEKKFIEEVVKGNITSIPSTYRNYEIKLESDSVVVTYVLFNGYVKKIQPSIDYYLKDISFEPIVEYDLESIYVSANSKVKIAVLYDETKYMAYLWNGNEQILAPNGMIIEVKEDSAAEYSIILEPTIKNSAECFSVEYKLWTEGNPEPDGLSGIFAFLCIMLCAVFFGLLFISGRKPKFD